MKSASSSTTTSARFSTRYPSGTAPPIQMPLRLDAATLSRMRSPVISLSNCAKDNSMGRLTLNMLLSFAQFEREITGERIRDKVAASKRKGIWMGGAVPLGYRVENRALVVVEDEADFIRGLFRR